MPVWVFRRDEPMTACGRGHLGIDSGSGPRGAERLPTCCVTSNHPLLTHGLAVETSKSLYKSLDKKDISPNVTDGHETRAVTRLSGHAPFIPV